MTAKEIAIGLGVFVATTVGSSVLVVAFLVRIPPRHFLGAPDGVGRRFESPLARAAYALGKNLLGLALVGLGLVLALPGVTGQGLLTMLVGLFLLDVPGKRGLELSLLRRPRVLAALNRIRARFDQPPLVVDEGSDR